MSGSLIFAALALEALLATSGRDDLAAALLACVVGGPPFAFPLPFVTVCYCLSTTFTWWQKISLVDPFGVVVGRRVMRNMIRTCFCFILLHS